MLGSVGQQGHGIAGRHGAGQGSQARVGEGARGEPIGSEESLQDMKQANPRADVYVKSLTKTANVRE